jgi:hypothetical protein
MLSFLPWVLRLGAEAARESEKIGCVLEKKASNAQQPIDLGNLESIAIF